MASAATSNLQSNVVNQHNYLADKIISLMKHVDPAHKVPFVLSKIKAIPKCDISKALVQGDIYIDSFVRSLDEDQAEELYQSITVPLLNNPAAMANKTTFNAVHYVVYGTEPKTAGLVIEEAYNSIGGVFASTAKQKEDELYHKANLERPERALEAREYELLNMCGRPFDAILKDNLPRLQKNQEVQGKFYKAIRGLLLKYQDDNLSALDLQVRLRYAVAKLTIALEQQGFVAEAVSVRTKQFGAEFAGDGLTGAFVDRTKKNPNKVRPLLTSDTKTLAAKYGEKLKEVAQDLKTFLGFGSKEVLPNVTVPDNMHNKVAEFIGKLEESPYDEEASRKLYNRASNLRAAYLNLQLEQQAAQGIDTDDPLLQELPYLREELVFAFESHSQKLEQRITVDDPKSYHPSV